MRRLLLICLLILTAATGTSLAERVELLKSAADVSLDVQQAEPVHSVISFNVGAFEKTAVDIGGQTYWTLNTGRESNRLIEGAPELPRICRSLVIPNDAHMTAKVVSADYTDYPNTPIAPSKGSLPRTVNPADVPYTFGTAYTSSGWYPDKLAELREPYIIRDRRAVVLEVNPFQYNPESQTLRVYSSITVEVVADGPGQTNVLGPLPDFRKPVSEFTRIYDRQLINWDQSINLSVEYTPVAETGDMLVVAFDSFYTAMQPFVEWKRQKGIRTTMVTYSATGGDTTSLKNYVQDFYDSTNLAWVVLVGDYEQIPSLYATGGPSDPSYVKLAGSDDYPDAFIGRFSAETVPEVETQVERTIAYEKTPLNTGWLHKATGIGSDADQTGHEGEHDWEHVENLRTDLLGFTYTDVDQIYDPGALASDVITALNDGRSLVNYCGHGGSYGWTTTSFAVSHIDSLTNTDKLPLIYSVGCRNGNFDNLTCFAEAWLRATHDGQPSGAIGTYMSSINQDWIPPMDAQDEAVDLLAADAMNTFGGVCFNSSCKMMDLDGASGVTTFNTWHIFGDPSLQMRTDSAHSLTVAHDTVALAGYLEFNCEVPGEIGALCALYTQGVLHGSAYTGAGGTATIPIEEPLAADTWVTFTVTAFNALPYVDSIYVATSSVPFVVFDSAHVGVTAGNINGVIDCGESIQLGVQLVNVGQAQADGVQAVLRSSDPYITVNDSTETYGTVAADWGTSFVTDAFAFDVAVDVPDRHTIEFDLDIFGSYADTARDGFELIAHTPGLGVVQVTIDDATGDNDGILDPGETANLVVSLFNSGSGEAASLTGVLSENDTYLSLTDSTGAFGTIDSISGTGDNSLDDFELSAEETCPTGHASALNLHLTTPNGYAVDLGFNVIVGDRSVFWSDDFSSDRGWTGLGGPAEWTIGSPSAGGGDPALDATPTGDNGVLGNDLTATGTYENDISETEWVESPVIDCSDIYGTILTFNRWLRVEGNGNDHVYLEVYNGDSWVRIFSNPTAPLLESNWGAQQFNLSSVADYNPAMRIRFGLGTTDGADNYAGWNIDDVAFSGYGTIGSPDLEIPQTSLSDSVQPGDQSENSLWVYNHGDGTLSVSFVSDSAWIDVTAEQQIVLAGDSLPLAVVFNGDSAGYGDHTGLLHFTSNDDLTPSGSLSVTIHVFAPELVIPDSIVIDSVHEYHLTSRMFTIINDGPGRLDYTVACRMSAGVTESPATPTESSSNDLTLGSSETVSAPQSEDPQLRLSVSNGGPDSFGHYWIDSDDPGGPIFNWQDISSSGTEVALSDDSWSGPVSLGFSFPLYDTTYSEIYIGSNGLLTFGAGDSDLLNRPLPTGTPPTPLIAPWWDNLDPANGGHVYYWDDAVNGRFIVSYVGVPIALAPSGTGALSFQAVLYPDGRIVLQYETMDGGSLALDRATIGVQSDGGVDALQIVYNEPYMHDSLAILISTDHWLSAVVPGVPITPYGMASIDVKMDASLLSYGNYSGELVVLSNDPDRPVRLVPVTLNVTVDCCQGPTGNVDCSGDNIVDIADIQVFVDNLFLTLTPLCCEAEADLDLSGGTDITDLQLLIDNQFLTLSPLPNCP